MSEGASLLSFLDSPVLVGDPDGRAIYVNPCFEKRFGVSARQVQGEQIAALFSGGAREAMLRAVADVCRGEERARFRLREGGGGYLALVSPIHSEGDRLGVIILLTDEPLADERVLAFHREMQEPVDEVRVCLEELLEQTGGRRNERYRVVVESALRSLERCAKWSDELHAVLSGRGPSLASGLRADPVRVVHQAAARVQDELASRRLELDLLVPARLPAVRGDGARLETALVHLLRSRLEQAEPGGAVALTARSGGQGAAARVWISLVEGQGAEGGAQPGSPPEIVGETLEEVGGRLHTSVEAEAGRVTLLALPLADGA